jgi:hypothetical protein
MHISKSNFIKCIVWDETEYAEKSTCLAYRKIEILPRNRSCFSTSGSISKHHITNKKKPTTHNKIQHLPQTKLKGQT